MSEMGPSPLLALGPEMQKLEPVPAEAVKEICGMFEKTLRAIRVNGCRFDFELEAWEAKLKNEHYIGWILPAWVNGGTDVVLAKSIDSKYSHYLVCTWDHLDGGQQEAGSESVYADPMLIHAYFFTECADNTYGVSQKTSVLNVGVDSSKLAGAAADGFSQGEDFMNAFESVVKSYDFFNGYSLEEAEDLVLKLQECTIDY